jgi:hypothetical protein
MTTRRVSTTRARNRIERRRERKAEEERRRTRAGKGTCAV